MKNKNEPTPIADYLKAVEFRNNRLWMIGNEGIAKTEVFGEMLTAEQFDKAFPIPSPINFFRGKENPDKTKSYLYK